LSVVKRAARRKFAQPLRLRQCGQGPRGLSANFSKETAQTMRRFLPLAVSLATLVAALLSADVTYWP
jgi:hypothetical protein